MTTEKPQVILIQYRNEQHEPIYAYVRVDGDKAALLREAESEKGLLRSSLGRIVASGRGEPSRELQAIIAERYDCLCRHVRGQRKHQAMA